MRAQTANYVVRSLEAADAERDWGRWIADPATATLLNAAPRERSVAERAAYIAKAKANASYLLGIFEKASDTLIGIWSIYVNEGARTYLLNVMIGPTDARNQGALTETRDVIYRHFFETLDMLYAQCTIVGSNTYMIKRLKRRGWTHEGTQWKAGPGGLDQVEILVFRLARDDWRALELSGEAY